MPERPAGWHRSIRRKNLPAGRRRYKSDEPLQNIHWRLRSGEFAERDAVG
jgi:hypothetical protein